MYRLIYSELLKMCHTFALKLFVAAPAVTLSLGYILSGKFVQLTAYNWWYILIYRIEHLNSRNSNAMKNHYLLTQISDILMQLYLAWNPYIKTLKQTIRNTSSGLLESFRGLIVTAEDVSYIYRYTTVYLE